MLSENILVRFGRWLDEAGAHPGISEPTAMCLATADKYGQPSARIVLLKGIDARGFVFYTNLESRKSLELGENPKASLCFYWMPLKRQIRINGTVERVSDEEADAYFSARLRESQHRAPGHRSSRVLLPSREILEKSVAEKASRFAVGTVPRPSFWSGWRVPPDTIEFWQEGDTPAA